MIILAPLLIGHVTRSMRSELLALNMGKCNFEALYLRKKCKVLHLGHDNNKATYSMKNDGVEVPLEHSTKEKDLGVWTDDKLKFAGHVGQVVAK